MLRMIIITILAASMVIACGSAPKHLYYEATTIKHKPIDKASRGGLINSARSVVGARSVRLRNRTQTYRKIKTAQVKSLPRVVLWALSLIHI